MLALLWALAACAAPAAPGTGQSAPEQGAATPTSDPSGARMVMAETAWLSVSRDGAVYTTLLDPDGRYRDLTGGTLAFAGRWEQRAQGQLCFEPDRGMATCWKHDTPGPTGVMRATGPDGQTIEVKRVAYSPPAQPVRSAPAEGDTGASGAGAAGDLQSSGG